jgi:transcriptional regulator with GAF, ATPase, and Fis domain
MTKPTPSRPATTFTLELYQGERLLSRHPISNAGATLGRDPKSTVVLEHPDAEPRHADLAWLGKLLVLRDCSKRGTFHKGARVSFATLESGDEFLIGPFRCRLVQGEREAPVASAALGMERLVADLIELTGVVGAADLQAVLEAVLEKTMAMLSATRGFVVLVFNGELTPVLKRLGDSAGSDERFSQTVCRQVVTSRMPVELRRDITDTPIEAIASLSNLAITQVLAVPLIDEETVLGVLYLESAGLFPPLLSGRSQLLTQISVLGGRALKTAVQQRELVLKMARWNWIASQESDAIDPFRTAQSSQMRAILEDVRQAAQENVPVLLRGESGTGKEVLARSIHELSDRRTGPFVPVNCAAVPRDLLESELFGHEKGAFTGASDRKLGWFELANGGTLLLDEVGDMPRELQTKLLRVLEQKSIQRLGGQASIELDIRIIAATNCDLEAAIASGTFRQDLYYRLNVVSFTLPPLRERREDIQPIVHQMLLNANRKFRRRLLGVAADAMMALENYAWPGNLRELRNVIDRAFILERSDRLTLVSLPFKDTPPVPSTETSIRRPPLAAIPETLTLQQFLEEQERLYITQVLDRHDSNISLSARVLGLTRTGLQRKMRRLGLRPAGGPLPDDDGSED